ncbi:hypothetical protein [Paenibacillus sabuli]|nr:hypothetical protein [Paenibacillus sabuli]
MMRGINRQARLQHAHGVFFSIVDDQIAGGHMDPGSQAGLAGIKRRPLHESDGHLLHEILGGGVIAGRPQHAAVEHAIQVMQGEPLRGTLSYTPDFFEHPVHQQSEQEESSALPHTPTLY